MTSEPAVEPTAFAIGCFHFGVKKEPPFTLSGKQYVDELTTFISLVPSIEFLDIDFDDNFSDATLDIDAGEVILPIMEGDDYFPAPEFGIVVFTVRIPYRVQSSLIGVAEKFLDTYTEDFLVQIRYPYHWPVAFVQPFNVSEFPDPSTAVQVVREFLKQEFSKVSSDWIRFEYLGPSPYHVRCYISPNPSTPDSSKARVSSTRAYSRGYDRIDFFYDKSSFEDDSEVREFILSEIENDLSLFYKLVQLDNIRDSEWDKLRTLLGELIRLQKRSGWRGHLERLLKSQSVINEIFIDLANFESSDMSLESFTRREYETSFLSELSSVFKNDVDKVKNSKLTYPTQEISKLVQFFEDRRNRAVETRVVIIAAILGGIVGSVITAAFTGGR